MTTTLGKLDALEAPPAEEPASELPLEEERPSWLSLVDWRTVAGALLLAGVVHIVVVFTEPARTSGTAFERLRETLPVNRVVLMPPAVAAKQPLPFMMPDALYAFCRFDVSVDSLRVTTALPDPGWTLSLHTPQGDNFYVAPSQLRRADFSLVIVPGVDRLSEVAAAPRRVSAAEAPVAAPTLEGLVMVRAPLKGFAYRAEAEAVLARTACNAVKR